jgi:dTDP-4-amino-4,6-dideoxygalactose transaminase
MWSYKDHGKSFEAVYNRQHPPGFRWLHESFGTNWRMTEMQAAIGRIQLKRMSDWTAKRRYHAGKIDKVLSHFDCVRLVSVPDNCTHAEYKHYCFIEPEKLNENWTRDRIVEKIVALGVPCFQGSCSEVYLEKAFDNTGWRPKQSLPNAKKLGETSVMFLVHPTLTEDEVNKTCLVIEQVLKIASFR